MMQKKKKRKKYSKLTTNNLKDVKTLFLFLKKEFLLGSKSLEQLANYKYKFV